VGHVGARARHHDPATRRWVGRVDTHGEGTGVDRRGSNGARDAAVDPGAAPVLRSRARFRLRAAGLRRDEPVEITVVNRLPTHTSVHWHGIELESFYDGIAGWSGAGDQRAPMLAPRDSFIVRFTPPRAGTFIYHAHVTDHVQLARGLYGALVVLPPDRPLAPGTDHVAIVGLGRPNGRAGLLLNGSVSPAPLERRRQGTQRVRVINISPENNVIFTLSADSMPMRWRAVAKDGFDLPPAQRRLMPARVQIFPGETYDFEFESAADVVHLRMKNPATGPGVDDITLLLKARP
jgi:FtsP/CotA-like multicopper oxidase with cupredoxin domain